MQYACAILPSVACPALQYFTTLPHIRHNFRKKLLNIKCVFVLPLQRLSETFLILRRSERDMTKNVYWSSCTRYSYPILMKLKFPYRFSKNTQISNFIKIRPVIAELLHADRLTDGQTSMTKLTVAFRKFSKVPNKYQQTKCFNTAVTSNTTIITQNITCTTLQ